MDSLEVLSATRGFFLRREAVALGVDDRSLTRGVRVGIWVRLRQGAYCHTEHWRALSDVERHTARAMASQRLAPGETALSHVSACAAWGAPLWRVPLDHVHLTRLDGGGARVEAGVRHHIGKMREEDVVERDGYVVTSPTRSTLDCLSTLDVERGMVVGDWMFRQGLTDFDRCAELKKLQNHWPFTRVLEVVLRLLDGRAASPGESRARYLCYILGLPMPELQYEIYDGSRLVAITDLAWPEHNVYGEHDGRVKYGRALKPGQDITEVLFGEKRREDDIRRVTKGTVVRWTWSDLRPTSAPTQQLIGLLRRSA